MLESHLSAMESLTKKMANLLTMVCDYLKKERQQRMRNEGQVEVEED